MCVRVCTCVRVCCYCQLASLIMCAFSRMTLPILYFCSCSYAFSFRERGKGREEREGECVYGQEYVTVKKSSPRPDRLSHTYRQPR